MALEVILDILGQRENKVMLVQLALAEQEV